jgi:hypothetical protein
MARSLRSRNISAAQTPGFVLIPGLLLLSLAARADISSLAWMAGCWAPDGGQHGSVEQWTAPAGRSMLGMSRTVRDGKTVFFEFLRIVEEDDGWTGLIASPAGQETARFELVDLGPKLVVFENPNHDFPQRISYRLTADGNLHGRIEGQQNGETRSAEFPMTRAACDNGDDPD